MLRRSGQGRAGRDGSVAAAELRVRLGAVQDPVLFHRLDELETLKEVHVDADGTVAVRIAVPNERYPLSGQLRDALLAALAGESGRADPVVALELVAMEDGEREALARRLRDLERRGAAVPSAPVKGAAGRPNPFSARRATTRVLAIASGKGGVGKSSVTVNLAVALARAGYSTGLLDADIYGFSVPRMLGVEHPPSSVAKVILPPVAHGVRCISMGFFVEEATAVAWRGPMLHKALEQFLVDVHWGELDFLVVDMPPGTGDVALSVAQQLPGAEFFVVTTPQPAAQRVAQRAGALARQLRLPLRGVIENMSWFTTPNGERYDIFGSGGGEVLAASLGVPLLARIPLVPSVREGADDGRPAVVVDPVGEVALAFEELARKISELGPARVYRSELSIQQ